MRQLQTNNNKFLKIQIKFKNDFDILYQGSDLIKIVLGILILPNILE